MVAAIAAGVAAVGSIGGGLLSAQGAGSAANAQEQASMAGIAEQQREYNQSRTDQLPWLTTGSSALDQLGKLYGLDTYQNGAVQKGTQMNNFGSFWQSPDYKITNQMGLAGVDAGAAAGGSLDSGATRKAEIAYSGNLASSQFDNYANRLAGIAGVGQTAASGISQAGANAANQITQGYNNYGSALASGYLAQGSAYGQTIGQLGGIGSGLIQNNPQFFGSPYNAQHDPLWGG